MTMKRGGDGEEIFAFIFWIIGLIVCCLTGVGCLICGPLLILTLCAFDPTICTSISQGFFNGSSYGTPNAKQYSNKTESDNDKNNDTNQEEKTIYPVTSGGRKPKTTNSKRKPKTTYKYCKRDKKIY